MFLFGGVKNFSYLCSGNEKESYHRMALTKYLTTTAAPAYPTIYLR